jgi:hypothetical protein
MRTLARSLQTRPAAACSSSRRRSPERSLTSTPVASVRADRTAVRVDLRRAGLEPRIGSVSATMPESARIDVPTIVGDAWPRGPSQRVSLLLPTSGLRGWVPPASEVLCDSDSGDFNLSTSLVGMLHGKLRRIRGAGDARLGASASRSERCRSGRGGPRHPKPARIDELPRPRAIHTGTIADRPEKGLVEITVGRLARWP